MALSNPQTLYGVHGFTFFDRATRVPIGMLKVVGKVEIAQSGSFNDLYGGSSRFPFDSEAGILDTTITLNTKQWDRFLFAKCLGAATSNVSPDASGDVSALTNLKGTSIVNGTTGLASVGIDSGEEADLKTGLYVVQADTEDDISVYCLSDVDFAQGTNKVFFNDTMKIHSGSLAVADTSATVDVPDFGIEFTGGSGTIAFVTGDTAYFYVRKINAGTDLITVGSANQVFEEFGVLWTTQRKSNGDLFEVMAPRVKAIGMPLPMSEQAWATADISMKCLYDSSEDAVYKVRRILGA